MSKKDAITNYARLVGSEVATMLMTETGRAWNVKVGSNGWGFRNSYVIDGTKIKMNGEWWDFFKDDRPKMNDPLDFSKQVVETDYDMVVNAYKRFIVHGD